MAPIKVGLIGLGTSSNPGAPSTWGVNAHLRSIQALPELYHIVAVCNSSVESAQKSIEHHKLPASTKAYGDPEDIAADPNVELVVVSVEVRNHYKLTLPALQHKKAVFVEWPLGVDVKQAEELTTIAKKSGVRNMVGLQARSDPLVQKVKQILAAGTIGQVVSSTVHVCASAMPFDVWGKGIEFYLDLKSGGNEFTIFLGHFLDSFTYVLGDFKDIQAILKTHYDTIPIVDIATGQLVNPAYRKTAPDHTFIQGSLESDALVSIAFRKAKKASDGVGYRWYITGTDGEIAITTEEGSWQMAIPAQRKILLRTGKEDAAVEVDYEEESVSEAANKVGFPGSNTTRQYENFAKEGGGEVVTFEEALKNHRLLDRIAKAAGWEL